MSDNGTEIDPLAASFDFDEMPDLEEMQTGDEVSVVLTGRIVDINKRGAVIEFTQAEFSGDEPQDDGKKVEDAIGSEEK